LYLNASKVATSGSALTFDGTNLGIGTSSPGAKLNVAAATSTIGSLRVDGTGTGAGSLFAGMTAGSIGFLHSNTGTLAFGTSTTDNNLTERARITSGGNLDLQKNIGLGGAAATTSGTGITFPATQSASSNAKTLDDYEEGTWPATLTDGTNTVTSDGATYRKIGSLVFVSFQFYNKNISAWNAANLSVTGLPFTVATNHDSFITVGTPNGFTVSGPLTMSFGNGSTSLGLYYRGGSSNWAAVQKGDITNNANFSLYLSACYTAS
jgi:hypothetical protein